MNVMGYYGLLVGLQYRNSSTLAQRLAEGKYSIEETESLKIFQPGIEGREEYVALEGEFVRDGQVFRLIKQRHYRDTFQIVFIKDERGTLIRHALADYARSFSEKTQDQGNQLIVLPIFIREYIITQRNIDNSRDGVIQKPSATQPKIFIGTYCPTVLQPPQIG